MTESRRGGHPWNSHGPPHRSFSPAKRFLGGGGGERGPARVAESGGDRGDWAVVRSRKRKATEPDLRGRDWSRGSGDRRGTTAGRTRHRLQGSDGGFRDGFDTHQKEVWGRNDGSNSNFMGGRVASAEWHSTEVAVSDIKHGYKASFYVTNFPENMPLFRLRQAFEVCGILSELYVARHRNTRVRNLGL